MKEITSRRSVRLLMTFLLCCIVLPAAMFAQSAGFGSITGVVQDPSGAVLSGATVVIDNASKGIHRELTTSGAGIFSAPALVPASGYQVVVSAKGFGKYEVKDITVNVGQNVSLDAKLKVATGTTSVDVTAAAPLVDFNKTDTSNVVGSDQILDLPINGRRVDVFVLLTPGVANDGYFGLLSFRGNPGGNNFMTDGNDTTNSYYDENAGRTRTYNISQDAVQEFQVVSSNFLAEYGKASGGVVNTVTRSGSNSLHGSAYEFYRNENFAAIDRTTKSGLAPNGINPPESRHQAGISLGGPIKKDKLFFFVNAEFFRRDAPAVSSNLGGGGGNNLFDGKGNLWNTTSIVGNTHTDQTCQAGGTVTTPGGQSVTGPTAAQCAAAVAYLTSRVTPQLIARTMSNNMLFAKLDYHPTSKDSISMSGNYLDFKSPNGIQTQLSLATGAAIGNNADTNVFDRTGRLSWTRVVSNNSINEFRFGLFKDRQFDPASKSLLPSFGGVPSPLALSVNSVSNLAYATNYPRLNPSELRLSFADTYSLTLGKNTLKVGADMTHLEDFVISMPSQYPSYTYNPSGAFHATTLFALDFQGSTPTPKQAWSSFSQTTGNRQVDLKLWELAFFAQDEYHATPKLTITPGLRYEYTSIPQPGTCNPTMDALISSVTGKPGTGTCKIPGTTFNLAPRLGIAYALNQKTAIRAGYGVFFNRYTTSSLENLMVTNGVYQLGYSYNAAASIMGCMPSFPTVQAFNWTPSGACAKTITPAVLFADPKFRNAYSEQGSFALDRELSKNLSLSVSYVWSRSLHIIVAKDTNVAAPTHSLTYNIMDKTGANVVGTYTTPVYSSYNPAYQYNGSQYSSRVSELQSAGNSYYNALLVNLTRKFSKSLQGSASYTYGHTIDQNLQTAATFGSTTPSSYNNGDYRGDKGSSELDRRHNLIINAVFQPTLMKGNSAFAKYIANGWQLSGVEVLASSQPYVPGFNGSLSFTSGMSSSSTGVGWKPLSSSLNGLGGSFRIPFMSTSALNIGGIARTDLRLTKVVPLSERVSVMVGFEGWNIFNHLIVSGRDANAYSLAMVGVDASGNTSTCGTGVGSAAKPCTSVHGVLTPSSTYGNVTATQITPDGTTARRAQILARITW